MIYFIEAVGANLLKIGFTERDPEERLKELQTGCPHKLRLVATTFGDRETERLWHDEYADLRTSGEWFRLDDRLRGYLWWLEYGEPEIEELRSSAAEVRRYHHDRLNDLDRRMAALENELRTGRVESGRSLSGDCLM